MEHETATRTRIMIALLAVAVISGCASIKRRPVVDYPMNRPVSVVTEQPINPIVQ